MDFGSCSELFEFIFIVLFQYADLSFVMSSQDRKDTAGGRRRRCLMLAVVVAVLSREPILVRRDQQLEKSGVGRLVCPWSVLQLLRVSDGRSAAAQSIG